MPILLFYNTKYKSGFQQGFLSFGQNNNQILTRFIVDIELKWVLYNKNAGFCLVYSPIFTTLTGNTDTVDRFNKLLLKNEVNDQDRDYEDKTARHHNGDS